MATNYPTSLDNGTSLPYSSSTATANTLLIGTGTGASEWAATAPSGVRPLAFYKHKWNK